MTNETAIPRSSGKMGLADLAGLPVLAFDTATPDLPPDLPHFPARLRETQAGFIYDYLWHYRPGARRLFVLFSGDAQRSRNDPPVFQRWSWAPHFPGHCLYVSDPSLHMDDRMGLAWYAGTGLHDPLVRVMAMLRAILPGLGLGPRDVFAYGSSGGGFAALRLAALMEGIGAVAINPQTDITAYSEKSVDRYLRVCLGRTTRDAALRDFADRLRLSSHVQALGQRRLVYVQNIEDTHHLEDHFRPFCAAMGAPATENLTEGRFRRILFDDPRGHRGAESQDVFATVMAMIESGFGADSEADPAGADRT